MDIITTQQVEIALDDIYLKGYISHSAVDK